MEHGGNRKLEQIIEKVKEELEQAVSKKIVLPQSTLIKKHGLTFTG